MWCPNRTHTHHENPKRLWCTETFHLLLQIHLHTGALNNMGQLCYHDYTSYTRCQIKSCLRAVLLAFFFFSVVLLFTLAGAFFTLTAALFLLTLGQGLKTLQEIIFPRLEVCLDAAISAFHHVTVTFPAAHDARRAQHPKPLVHIFANLNFKRWNFKAKVVALLLILS